MNDDYLWDKSGKPNPDIQQLEEILGTLRYQPRELEIPPHIQVGRKSFIARGLAIAAAVALMVLGLGIWMNLSKEKATDSQRAAVSPVDEKKISNLPASVQPDKATTEIAPTSNTPPGRTSRSKTSTRHVTLTGNRTRNVGVKTHKLSESEVAEAMIAKDQLMLALRLASSKLSLAQKKTQGNSASEIHNQHKAG